MSFAEKVAELQSCAGVMMTSIADKDGIQVQSWGGERRELEEIVAEYSTFLHEVTTANRELALGELDQVVVAAQRRLVIVTAITTEYFLLTVVDRNGNTGRARFASRLAAHRLKEEFS
jgi:predicted regulator of Ras-like GTPase activity (Roadblock/LC7/MglB family)